MNAVATTEMRSALDSFIATLERREKLQAELKAVESEFNRVKAKLAEAMASEGYDEVGRNGLTVILKEEIVAKIDLECRTDIIRWALCGGHSDAIECKPINGAIAALIKEGVGVPEGISIESSTKLNWKRD